MASVLRCGGSFVRATIRAAIRGGCWPHCNLRKFVPTGRCIWIPFRICTNSIMTTSALQKTVPFLLSDIGEGIAEVTVKEWNVQPGDKVAEFDSICEVQSDKATVGITSRYSGIVRNLYHEVDGIVKVGEALIDIELEANGDATDDQVVEDFTIPLVEHSHSVPVSYVSAEASPPVKDEAAASQKALATPAVRNLARELKVNLADVLGTGKNGRVLKEDVHKFVEVRMSPLPSAPTPVSHDSIPSRQDERKPVQGFMKTMLKTMTASNLIPHLGFHDEIRMNELVKFRERIKETLSQRGVHFTYMPFFIKAASQALLKFPIFNSSFNDDLTEITYKANHNISVAMDTPDGLVVPNVKSVQTKSILEIAEELNRLQELGAKNHLGPNELGGGTFTISNIGNIGGTYVMPLIVPPQVCIGATGRIQTLPRFGACESVVATHVMKVSWSADHRIIDGATMARFSNVWKAYLEDPSRLLLDLR